MSIANRNDRGTLVDALDNAAGLLAHDPQLAEQQAYEILKIYPDSVNARQFLAAAFRLQKKSQKALNVLEPLLDGQSDSADFLHEIAQCLGGVGRGDDAIEALRKALDIDPEHKGAWDSLGHQLAVAGDEEGSREAFQRHFELSTPHPELVEATRLLRDGKQGNAETIVRELLKKHPTEVTAIKVLADIGVKMGQLKDASHLLERCLELAPNYHAARHLYAIVLMRRQESEAAIAEAEKLLALEPDNPNFLTLKASILNRIGNQSEALEIYEKTLKDYPNHAKGQMSYGHTLHAVGRVDEAIEAYKKSVRPEPGGGRSLLEPGQSENLPIQRRRDRQNAQARNGRGWRCRRSGTPGLFAGESSGGPQGICGSVHILQAWQRYPANRASPQPQGKCPGFDATDPRLAERLL